MNDERCGYGVASGAISFIVGGIVGAGVGLLVAPKPGKETRNQIRGVAGNAKERTEDYYERVRKSVVSALESGEGFLEEKKEAIASAVRAGIEAYQKTCKQDQNKQGSVEPSIYG
jgi:gas vesicle protein